METKHIFTEEEFEVIQAAIKDIFSYYGPFIEASDGEGRSTSMSFETFFKDLKSRLNVKGS